MNEFTLLICILPILFIFHDFEEIIFSRVWLDHHKEEICLKFPFMKRALNMFGNLNTPAFSLAVLEEFIIISVFTIIALAFNETDLWYICFLTFSIHLLMHIIQSIAIRGYIPAVVTSVICLPYSIYTLLLIHEEGIYNLTESIIYSLIGIIFFGANLLLIHSIAGKLYKLLANKMK